MLKNVCRSSHWIRKSAPTNPTNTVPTSPSAKTGNPATASAASGWVRNLTSSTNLSPSKSKTISINYLTRNMSTTEISQTSQPQPKHTNRLAQEKSPYLLQHAHNPVDWYPWGDEAIQRAQAENKLIFLSVGYSTCHWCHVMEHESFENEDVAAIMNANFINIKVDREERPDIDKIYMHFVLLIVGHGGWPMSVWLTPQLAPITGGTYFPPTDRYGMPSFTKVITKIATEWKNNQGKLSNTGNSVISEIRRSLTEKSDSSVIPAGSVEARLEEALAIFKSQFDPNFGGFSKKPKFPEVSRINFLFHAYIATKDLDVLDMALQTLRKIANGGIHDHIFGGFARYAVDNKWHVPHFEKMLYDQGQLMSSYANAYKLTREPLFLDCADGIFRYLMKDLRHPAGGFYAGEDADSFVKAGDAVKVEGAFYSWSWDEIKNTIEAKASEYEGLGAAHVLAIYAKHYDLRPMGNVAEEFDPHGFLSEKNVFIVRGSFEETCREFDISAEQLHQILDVTNKALHDIRSKRPRPHLDTKLICAWNGLALSGLSKLANCGSDKRDEYLAAAQELVSFIREHLYNAERKTLIRSSYGVDTSSAELKLPSTESIEGFLDDYSFVIKGLLDYYKSSLDGSALKWAKELQDIQDAHFWDETNDAYFYSRDNLPNVIVRLKDDHDGAEPCGNSVSARNLILLSHYYDDESYRNRAGRLLEFFNHDRTFGYRLPEMMSALLLNEMGLDLVAVVGPDSERTKSFVEICRKFYIPGMIIVHVDPQHRDEAYNQRVQEKFKMVNGQPTVYICHDKVCRMPVTDPAKLEANLTENFFKSGA